MKRLQELTREMKDLDATSTERTRLLVKANDLFDSWDKLCQQVCVCVCVCSEISWVM